MDEATLLTGSSDGLIRVVTLHPNKVLGVLGDHDGFPIEHLQFNASKSFVGSISHDPYIRLWDTKVLHDDDDDDEEEAEDEDKKPSAKASKLAPATATTNTTGGQASDDEWDDMDEDEDEEMKEDDDKDSDDSDDDSDDDGRPTRNDNRASRLKTKNEDFFADL